MPPTPEGKVKDAVKRVISNHAPHVYAFWPVQMGFGARTLDCLGCAYGIPFAVETKSAVGKVSEMQRLCVDDMRTAGMDVFVIRPDNVHVFADWMAQLRLDAGFRGL